MTTILPARLSFEIVGFSEHERALIASLFKATRTFTEWQPAAQPRPDCVLLNTDSEAGRRWRRRDLASPSGASIIAVGSEDEKELLVLAQLQSPLRSGQLLRTLNHKVLPFYGDALEQADGFSPTRSGFTDSMLLPGDCEQTTPKPVITKPSVLVINPNPVGWRYVSAKLTLSGYEVDHVSTGVRAMKLLEGHRYNGVILEPRLPDMDGYELCKLVKDRTDRPDTALIILTSSKNPLDRVRGTLAGCDAYLAKPMQKGALDSVMDKFLPRCGIEQYAD